LSRSRIGRGPIRVVFLLCAFAGANFASGASIPPGTPTVALEYVSGNDQSGAPLSTLAEPLTVQLAASGDLNPGTTPISWSILSGSATIVESGGQTYNQSATYNSSKSTPPVSIHIALGATPGPVKVRAYCGMCKQLGATYGYTATYSQDFNLTIAQPTLQIVSGDNQSGAVGNAASAPLVVQLTSAGAPVSGQTVNWNVAGGQATLSAATSVTDSNGDASINFTYGNGAGPITIQAAVAGSQVTFSASSFVPTTSTLSGNNQTGVVGGTLQPFVVQVGGGGASAPIAVNWSVVQGGGTLAAAQTFTDASGHASNTLTLGPNPGVNIVQATVVGAGSISFTATALAAVAGSSVFTLVSGNNQGLVPGQPSQPLVVKVAAADGTPISGVGIAWSASSANAKLAAASTTTASDGTSQNTLTVVLPGSYTVTAQITGANTIPALTFDFSNGVANLPSLSGPQLSTAQVIDKACPALATSTTPLTPQQQDFLQRCSELVVGSGTDPQQVPGALNAMLNNKALPQRGLAQGVQIGQFNNLNTRLAELHQGASGLSIGGLSFSEDGRGLPLAMLGDLFRKDPKQDDEVGKDFARWGFFATGMIDRGGYDATAVGPGFDYHNASLTAGVDYRFNADFVAGVALGYNANHSSLDQNAGKADVDSYSLNGYFSWYRGDYYIEGSIVTDWLNYDLNRNIVYQIDSLSGNGLTSINQTATASPNGHQSSLSLSIGKDFNRKAWSFSPYLRGVWSHLSLDGFSETMSDPNAPGAGLGTSVAGRSLTSELGVLGGRVSYTTSYDWGVLIPNAVLEWNHEFRNDPQTAVVRFLADPTQTPIMLTDAPPDSSYFNVGIGLNAVLPQGRSGYVYFEHLVGYSGAHEDRLSVGIRIEF
jgi:uncharacterized protein YhjY with autotransporter beta-barrel domain